MKTEEMITKKVLVTPEMAKHLILTNDRNRTLHRENVKKMEADILNGNWHVTHQGIAIDKNGKLVDGQHRLTAIAETGIPCEMMVTYNAPESEKIDVGAMRREKESLYMAGVIEKGTIEYSGLTYPLISYIIGRNLGARAPRNTTATTKHEIYQALREWIDPIIQSVTGKTDGMKSRQAPILYAMLCAYKSGVDIGLIRMWYYILRTGDFYVPDDDGLTKCGRSITLFRNFMLLPGRRDPEDVLKKAMSSIYYFVQKKPVTQIVGSLRYKDINLLEEYDAKK